jgi:ATP-dependent 26S proteasome regulatory subunit
MILLLLLPPVLSLCCLSPSTGSNYYVRILSTLNRELLKPSSSVALHRHSNALVDILPPEADSSISLLGDNEKPNVTYQVGALESGRLAALAGLTS